MKRKAYGRDAGLTARMALTTFTLGLLYVAFAAVLIWLLGGNLILVLVLVGGLAVFQYYTSDKLALRAAGAKVIQREDAPQLFDTVERLVAMAELPMPRVAIVDTDVPNAFATGRDPKHAAVAVTTGLVRRLEQAEIEAVLAHELTHIKNRDVRTMTLASFFAMLAALITRFAFYGSLFGGGRDRDNNGPPIWLILLLVSWATYALSWVLIQMISRYREYAADRGAAVITGAPEHLMSALQKIASDMFRIPERDLREVQGMNAFFIIPDEREEGDLGAVHVAPAAREAACGARRDRARDGAPGLLANGAVRATEARGLRRPGPPLRTLDRARHARGRARAEDGRRRSGRLQADVGRRVRPGGERPGAAPRQRRGRGGLEDRAQDGLVRLRLADRPRRGSRGPRDGREPRRLRAVERRLRAAAPRRAVPLLAAARARSTSSTASRRRRSGRSSRPATARAATTPRSWSSRQSSRRSCRSSPT